MRISDANFILANIERLVNDNWNEGREEKKRRLLAYREAGVSRFITLAEACGDRPHQGQRKPPLTGFEARARHQTNLTSATSLFYPHLLKKSIKNFLPKSAGCDSLMKDKVRCCID